MEDFTLSSLKFGPAEYVLYFLLLIAVILLIYYLKISK